MGRPIGSPNRQKPFRDALNVALRGRPLTLRRVADRLLDAAENGDLASIRELIDRLDGKASQVIEPADVPLNKLTDAELYAIAASGQTREHEEPKALPAPDDFSVGDDNRTRSQHGVG